MFKSNSRRDTNRKFNPVRVLLEEDKTRITRTPAFWGYPPPPHDYPYHWVILDPKSKEDKVKVTNLKNSPKFHYTRHTFVSCLIRCATMKWIWWVLLKIQSGHDSVHRRTDGRTDGQTDKVIPVYPPINFVEAGGIISKVYEAKDSQTSEMNNLKLMIQKQNESIKKLQDRLATVPKNNQVHNRFPSQRDKADIECYYCHEKCHYSRECLKKKGHGPFN